MPRTRTDVEGFLDRLDELPAHDLESQDLDFKEWDTRSLNQSVRTVVTSAVCMANGGGGTVPVTLPSRNATEMRESPFESHFQSNMYQEMFSADISSRNVSHFQSEPRPRSHGISRSFPEETRQFRVPEPISDSFPPPGSEK